jgi:hypothetical protein
VGTGVLGLFKFGEEPNIEKFFRLGQLFMRPLHELRSLEADELRGDKNEGVRWTIQPDQAKLQTEIGGAFRDIPGIAGSIRYFPDQDQNVNVSCMYALRRRNPQTLVNPENFRFGDTYVLLKDGDEFLRRVRQAIIPSGQQLCWQLVKYFEWGTYSGPMGIFSKFGHFQYQSEFRIALVPGTGKQEFLNVGDLSDITMMGKLSEINQHIKVE